MASSAGSIALALEGRAAMVTGSAVRTYGLTLVPRRPSSANASGARPSALIRNQHWKRRKKRIVPARAWAGASRCRAFDSVVAQERRRIPRRDTSRARRRAMWAQGRCVCAQRRETTTWLCRSGASLLRATLEQGTASGAEVATVMGHARPDTINVRDVLLAEPHRIRFAGRALLRRPLLRRGGPRRERERKAQERGRERCGGHDRPELRLCDTNFHYRPSS